MSARLIDLASVIRSKNSGPYELTLDIIFKSRDIYEKVKSSNALRVEDIARLYKLTDSPLPKIVAFDPALALKITFARKIPSGNLGDTDIYGAQQHAPLLQFSIGGIEA